uniref:Uncharacterized protein n=1 Tax=Anguilla anguilla TaxID=7936 RepID=A0A0E9WJ44_ANGAN
MVLTHSSVCFLCTRLKFSLIIIIIIIYFNFFSATHACLPGLCFGLDPKFVS